MGPRGAGAQVLRRRLWIHLPLGERNISTFKEESNVVKYITIIESRSGRARPFSVPYQYYDCEFAQPLAFFHYAMKLPIFYISLL